MKQIRSLLAIVVVVVLGVSCSKDEASPALSTTSVCMPTHYTTSLLNTYGEFTYQYTNGRPSLIHENRPNDQANKFTYGISYDAANENSILEVKRDGQLYGTSSMQTIYSYGSDKTHPLSASIYLDGVLAFGYSFGYNTKNRLSSVAYTSPQVDAEWTMMITYNAGDNVTKLEYVFTNGMSGSSIVTVNGYDDHPSPYTHLPMWKFMMDRSWNNNDPLPILAALSKNNPLDFTSADTKREMSYSYNEQGFPLERTSTTTNTLQNTTSTGTETFVYECN